MKADLVEVALMARWLQANITGCLFAKYFAPKLQPLVWRTPIDGGVPADLAPWIAECVKSESVAIILFPSLRRPAQIEDLLVSLESHGDWRLTSTRPTEDPRPEDILLRLDLRTSHGKLSTPIGFAPLGSMPVLRRAPYVALALWPGDGGNPHKPAKGGRVSLADTSFRSDDIPKAKYNEWFKQSVKNKGLFLQGQNEHAAEHNVTFCLPRDPEVIGILNRVIET